MFLGDLDKITNQELDSTTFGGAGIDLDNIDQLHARGALAKAVTLPRFYHGTAGCAT
jgi:hypothetical protein